MAIVKTLSCYKIELTLYILIPARAATMLYNTINNIIN